MQLTRIHIEVTNVCNLQCSFCPEVERDNAYMSSRQFQYVLDQACIHTNKVCLHLMGEPLSHPEFNQILDIVDQSSVKLELTTNGILLAKRINKLISFKNLHQINISLQSFKDNFPEKSLSEYLTMIMDQLDRLMSARPEVYLNLRLWNDGVEHNENEEIFSFLEQRYQLEINRRIDPSHIKGKKLFNRLYLHFDSRFIWPALDLPHRGEEGTCNALSHHIGIHANGTVVPCCLDKEAKINLGNVFEQSLTAILDSARATNMRAGFEQGKLVEKLCQHCPYIQRFDKKMKRVKVAQTVF